MGANLATAVLLVMERRCYRHEYWKARHFVLDLALAEACVILVGLPVAPLLSPVAITALHGGFLVLGYVSQDPEPHILHDPPSCRQCAIEG